MARMLFRYKETFMIWRIYEGFKSSIKNLNPFEKKLWLLSVVIVTFSFLIFRSENLMTLVASLIGVTALIFVAKGDVLGQILTIVFSLLYSLISFGFAYYGEMITYMGMTAPIALLSVITWLKNPYSEKQVKIRKLNSKQYILLLIVSLFVTWIFYYILLYFNTSNIVFSTISVTTSFLASSLMMLRDSYYALAYAANDLVLIVLWVMATLENISYVSMIACFSIFFINDIYGYINWSRMKKIQGKQPTV